MHSLDLPAHGGHHEELVLTKIGHRDHGIDMFARLQVDDVRHRCAARGARCIRRQFISAGRENATAVREHKQEVVRVGDAEVRRDVVFLRHALTLDALAAAMLRPVSGERDPLQVPVCAQRDHDRFVRLGILASPLAQFLGVHHRAAVVAEPALQVQGLLADDGVHLFRRGQQFFQARDERHELLVFVLDLLSFERGQSPELHVQDGLGLYLGQVELRHQARTGRFDIGGSPYEGDHPVQVIERCSQTLKDVKPGARFTEIKLGAAHYDLAAELDEVPERFLEGEHAWHAVEDRQHVCREAGPQGRVLVQVVQDHAHGRATAEVEHYPHAFAV